MLTYLNFDLLIKKSENSYQARILKSPAGRKATRPFSLPFSKTELQEILRRFRGHQMKLEDLKSFGGSLFKAVFADVVRDTLNASLKIAHDKEAKLRIRLRLEAVELADLPWEYLYDQAANQFLCLSVETTLMRYLELKPREPLRVELPLRIMVMISSPREFPQLKVEEEWANLRKTLGGLEEQKRLVLERLESPTLNTLQRRLRQQDYHIFHFIGHGGFDEQTQEGMLVLEDENGQAKMVSGRRLGTLMHDERTLQLAVFNSCESARSSASDPFAGLAQSIVQQGVPAVIATQTAITDMAAIAFAKEFYSAIVDNYPVDAALAEARKALYAQGNDLEWGLPTLYTRSPDGLILDVHLGESQGTSSDAEPYRETVGHMRAETPLQVQDDRPKLEVTGNPDQRENNYPKAEIAGNPPTTASEITEKISEGSPEPEPPPSQESRPTREPKFWLLAVDLANTDWENLHVGNTFTWREARRSKDKLNLRFAQVDDIVLVFNNNPEVCLVGLGRIINEPHIFLDHHKGERPILETELLYKFDSEITVADLERASNVGLEINPPSFTSLYPQDWTAIRAMILNRFPQSSEILPLGPEPENRILSIDVSNLQGLLTADEPAQFTIGVRNQGNVIWHVGDYFKIECEWTRSKNARPDYDTVWSRKLQEAVPPGGEVIWGDLEQEVPSEPGNYIMRWKVKGTAEGSNELDVRIVSAEHFDRELNKPSDKVDHGHTVNQKAIGNGEAEPVAHEAVRAVPGLTAEEVSIQTPKPQPAPAPVISQTPALSAPPIIVNKVTQVTEILAEPRPASAVVVYVTADTIWLQHGDQKYASPNLLSQQADALAETSSPMVYGQLLFEAIIHQNASHGGFQNSTLSGYDLAVIQTGGNLRFEIILAPGIPELHTYKWEYLKDPRAQTRSLASDELSPFYRRVGSTHKKSVDAKPLRILVAVCNPVTLGQETDAQGKPVNPEIRGLVKLDVEKEREIIETALERLKHAGLADYHIMVDAPPVTLKALSEELQKGYHVLHLLSHGLLTEKAGYRLVMEAANRHHHLVSVGGFRSALIGNDLRLVVLAACDSATERTGQALQALGPSLVGAEIPAVIAMQDVVRVDTAQLFTQHFYDDLARTGRVAKAMAATRSALYLESKGKDWQWGIPLLLMSTSDGRLFGVDEQQANQLPPLEPTVKDHAELAGQGDPTPQKLARALESEAARYKVDPAVLGALRAVVAPALASARAEPKPLALPQDRDTLTHQLLCPVDLRSGALQDYVEEHSGLKLGKMVYAQLASALNAGKHIILIGPPGTGKTSLAQDICRYAQDQKFTNTPTLTTATADWTAFDTVGGYVPTIQQTLQFRPGIFLQAIRTGSWLVIDEINRAEIDKAFGELFTVLSGQRADLHYTVEANKVSVLPYAGVKAEDWIPNHGSGLSGYDYVVHPNWRILGTMNVYDKSYLFAMSFAFMRRFAFVDIEMPDQKTYENLINEWAEARQMKDEQVVEMREHFQKLLNPDKNPLKVRALGPSIVKDMIWYVSDRLRTAPDSTLLGLLCEAFLLYATPQFDGLDREAIKAVHQHLNTLYGQGETTPGLLGRIQSLYPHIPGDEWVATEEGNE
ncbi:MAG: CHAT domain-containing protein [Acidobacteria bacterium]|nr:CHAT domain-containing protein [Acidobacteriota bacterium]